jgi:hypothetical protein
MPPVGNIKEIKKWQTLLVQAHNLKKANQLFNLNFIQKMFLSSLKKIENLLKKQNLNLLI